MRTGVCYQGKEVLAVCLDDTAQHLSVAPKQVCDSIKALGWGNNNLARDFVPKGSTNSIVRRPTNSY